MGYAVNEVAELLSFSTRWVHQLAKGFALDIPPPSLCQTVSGMVPLTFHQPEAAHERLLRSPQG
jgi:hypothetical protein